MAGHGIVSADSHMMEPADLWQQRLDRRFRDRAPRVIRNPDPDAPSYVFLAEGAPPFPVAGGFAAGRSGEELAEFMNEGYEAARPSGWDPVERIKDQEVDGIDAEVLYPTLGMTIFSMSDAELQRACFAAYNDWVAEFCAHDRARLYGIGLISLENVETAREDVEGIAKQGMRGAMIWGSPPEDRPYSDRAYDPFWQIASELRLPVSLHIVTGRGRQASRLNEAMGKWGSKAQLNPGVTYTTVIHEIQESLATLVFGAVFERFPELRIVSAENDTGWLPHIMYRMDHAHEKYGAMLPEKLSLKPSEYIRRQLWATFQDDPIGPITHEIFGAENYMWASDFPHSDSTFPESHAWIEKNFAGVPDAVRRKIVYENAVGLYGMNLGSS
jgi:predicted TIM-barrel fold metal-dependent hydrolase